MDLTSDTIAWMGGINNGRNRNIKDDKTKGEKILENSNLK